MPSRSARPARPTRRAALAVALALAACADPSTAPRPGAVAFDKAPPSVGSCSTAPAQGVRVEQNQVTLTVGGATDGSATVTACTQYAGDYTISVAQQPTTAGQTVVSVGAGATVTPTRPSEGAPVAASIPITAVSPGTATITVTDRKGYTATIIVTVQAPAQPGDGIITFSPPGSETDPFVINRGGGTTVTISEGGGYPGLFHLTGVYHASGAPSCLTRTSGRNEVVTFIQCDYAGGRVVFGLRENGFGSGTRFDVSGQTAGAETLRLTAQVADDYGRTAEYTVEVRP